MTTIDLHLPTSWNGCTTADLEAIAAAIIAEQQRTDRYHPFDWSRVKLAVVLAINAMTVVADPSRSAQPMVNGQRSMVNGQSSMVNGQSSMVNGQSSMVNGQWSMVNGQLSPDDARALVAAITTFNQTVADMQQKGIPCYINKYGRGGLIDEVKSGMKFMSKYEG